MSRSPSAPAPEGQVRKCICATCGKKGKTTKTDPVYCPACLDAMLKPGQRYATCRICGAIGIEDADDPVPGICPECLAEAFGVTE